MTGGLPAQLFWFYVLTTAESSVKIWMVNIFNAFKPNGISHSDQLEQSISILRDVEWYFSFYSNLNRTLYKQIVDTLIRRLILWRLVWVCTICLHPTKRTPGLYGLMPLSGEW